MLRVLQRVECVAVGCIVLQCVAAGCSVLQCVAVRCSALQCVAARCSVLQCVAVRCSVLQCDAVYFSMLHDTSTREPIISESGIKQFSRATYESPAACEVFSIPSLAYPLVNIRVREYYPSTKCAAIVDSQGNGCVLRGDVSEDEQRSADKRSVC